MALSRGPQKFDRLTITFVPTNDERSYRNVPSTFSTTNRTYVWRQLSKLSYMLVPKRISSHEIKVDIFVDSSKGKKTDSVDVQRIVQDFVKEKIQSDWRGLKFAGITRAAAAIPPEEVFSRGTIEEILGAKLDN